MAQYVLMATLQTEEAADRLLNILVRKGISAHALGPRDPVVSGPNGSLVVLLVDTTQEDLKVVKQFIQSCIGPLSWVSLLLARAEGMTNLSWSVAGAKPANPAQALAVAQARAENPHAPIEGFNEDEWFAAGDDPAFTAPEQEG